jgi:hypothetical protein
MQGRCVTVSGLHLAILLDQPVDQKYHVCFTDDCTWKPARILSRGFRHCFVVWKTGDLWYSFDPMYHHHEWEIVKAPGYFDVPGWLQGQGHIVVDVFKGAVPDKLAPVGLMTCTESLKRFLGIHAFQLQTPRQLYRYLTAGRAASGVL